MSRKQLICHWILDTWASCFQDRPHWADWLEAIRWPFLLLVWDIETLSDSHLARRLSRALSHLSCRDGPINQIMPSQLPWLKIKWTVLDLDERAKKVNGNGAGLFHGITYSL